MAQDLNSSGAIGDAASATAEIGAKILELAVSNLIELIGELAIFDLSTLSDDNE